jgi:hypothetical protein
MVDPDTKTVQVCTLENGRYITTMYGDTDTISVQILDGCTINLKDVFEE